VTAVRPGPAVALTVLSGALYGIAFPPVGWWPVAWIALVPFLVAIRGASAARSIGLGALLGVAASLGVGTWMPDAVVRYYAQPFLVGAVVFLVCAFLQACWQYALFALACGRLGARGGPLGPLAVAAAWTAAELARAKPSIGNPWAMIGYSQVPVPLLVQTADVAGVFGVGFVVAAVNAAIAEWWIARRTGGRPPVAAALVVGGVVGAILAYGVLVMRRFDAAPRAGAVPVVAAQANLDLGVQWRQEFYGANLATYAGLTRDAVRERRAGIVVWPESALTFFLESEPAYRAYLATLAARSGIQLLTGGPRVVPEGARARESYRNAAFVLSPGGEPAATYEKRWLVPFAEYFPFPSLDFLRREFGRVREFTPGTLQAPLPTLAGPVGVTICNESMLAEHTIDRVRAGATWLVTLTNDSWVGRRQYADIALEMSRLRAVEVRRWLVRSSTSGPSAVIDPVGRLVDRKPFDTRGIVRGDVTPRHGFTPYSRIGDVFAWTCALVALVLVLAPSRGRRG
jgi:apolipoprotein N-acyltransferase